MRLLCGGLLLLASAGAAMAADSTYYGTTSTGRLENGVQMPESGPNFSPYSGLGVSLGRTYAHSKVAQTVGDAWAALAKSMPGKHYTYGESGWKDGGSIKPHRTHENGTAVDFMVPVVDAQGRSIPLPTSPLNKFGYAIEFDAQAQYEGLTIDVEAIAAHLEALHAAALKNGIGIQRVIFDHAYIPKLQSTSRGSFIKEKISFMKGQPWVRHDEHYHVDFAVACKPFNQAKK